MALLAILEKLEGLSSDVAKEYKQRDDGKYVLDVTPVGTLALQDVSGLKSAHQKDKGELQELKSKLQAFDALGDPDKAAAAIKEFERLKELNPEGKAKEAFLAKEKALTDSHNSEKGKLESRIARLTTQLEKRLVRVEANRVLDSKYHGASVELLMPHIESRARMRQIDDENYAAAVFDEHGKERFAVHDGTTVNMTIEDLIDEMAAQKPFQPAFPAKGGSGSGASATAKGASQQMNGGQGDASKIVNPIERLKAIRRKEAAQAK